jgi:hypothetical protein
MFAVIEDWIAVTGKPSPDVQTGSQLAGDARKSSQHQVGHAAWNGITHAVDQLHALKTLIAGARVVHTYAPYSLLRSATENAATAVWLLAPAQRTERLTRCLRLARHEAWESSEVAKLLPPKVIQGKRSAKERIDEIRDLAATLGLNVDTICSKVYYEGVVKQAGEATNLGADLSALLWRLGSGFDHGRYWASFGFLPYKATASDVSDVLNVRLSTTADQVLMVAQVPFLFTAKALQLFEDRRRRLYPS